MCQNIPIRERASRVKTYPFVNGFRLVYIIMLVFCVCVCVCVCVSVCVSVCLFYLRSREREVVSPLFLHRREELRLASCTDRFSGRYDAPLER